MGPESFPSWRVPAIAAVLSLAVAFCTCATVRSAFLEPPPSLLHAASNTAAAANRERELRSTAQILARDRVVAGFALTRGGRYAEQPFTPVQHAVVAVTHAT